MKPRKLVLKGFRGIQDGLGRDVYELDLEGLGDARLVAIAGPNGKGKSTVLDNLHPFPILPSRATSYSVSAFSMYEHIVAPEAVKELDWEHQGRTYRSSFLWRLAGKRKSSEAYLFEHQDGFGWVPVRIADGTVSDGKVETYNRALAGILGTPEMFFSSVFSAQGRRKLFEYKEGELKQLLVELLNLGEISRLAGAAGQVVKSLGSAAEALRIAATPPADAPDEAALATRIAQADARSASLALAKGAEDAALRVAQDLLARARAEVERDTSKAVRERLARERSMLDAADVRESAQRASRETLLRSELNAVEGTAKRAQGELAGQRKSREDAITYRQGLLAQREAVRGAPAAAERLGSEIAALEGAIRLAGEGLQAQLKARGELAVIEADLNAKREGYARAKQALSEIEVRARLTNEVPCQGTALQPRCKLLREALDAVAKIPQAKQALEALEAQGIALGQKRAEAEVRSTGAGDPARALAEAEAAVGVLRKAREDAQRLAALAPSVERAQAEVQQLKGELEHIEAEHAQAALDRESRTAELVSQLATVHEEAHKAAEFFAAERARIEAELAKLAAPDADALAVANTACEVQCAKLRQVERELDQAKAQGSALRSQLAVAREASRQRREIRSRCERVRAEQAFWQLLAKGLGKDGLIAMLIDEAGPTLAAIANDILLACYGRRFTVSIVTQRVQANGEMVETFDILVHDAESDDAKSLGVMSGGQKVWINEALTRAIALYMAQGSERQYGTLFCDESDGPLDAERKQMFVAMQRKVLELGRYHRAYFITQTPELLAHADRVIELQ